MLAGEFPASTFVGYDLDGEALDRARARAAERGLANLTFERCDAAELTVDERFDAGFGDVAVHDAPGDPGNAVFVTRKPA